MSIETGMNKPLLSLYVESTIPSYATAWDSRDALHLIHQILTRSFWKNERHRFSLFTSQTVLDECSRGDSDAAMRRIQLIQDIPLLAETDKAIELSLFYQQLLKIPERAKNDSIHLALCVTYKVDLLLTWNCTHLGPVAQRQIQGYNAKHGLWTPALVTPETINEIIAKDKS